MPKRLRARISSAALLVAFTLLGGFAGTGRAAADPGSDRILCQSLTQSGPRLEACGRFLTTPGLPVTEAAAAHFYRAMADLDVKDRGGALLEVQAALDANPNLWPAHWIKADLATGRRDYPTAVKEWSALIALQPTLARLYAHRAAAEELGGQFAESIADYSHAIELAGDRGDTDALEGRAAAHYGARHWDQIIADYSKVLETNQKSEEALRGRATALYLTGQFDAATADLRQALEANPKNGYSVLWLYLSDLRLHRPAAEELRRRAGALDLKQWPGPIVEVLLGDRAADAVKPPDFPEAWSQAERQQGAQCELAFYRAEQALAKGARTVAIPLLHAAVEAGIPEYIEARAAQVELERMGNK